MSQPPDLADVLAALAAVLRAQGIAWYVFGAQAVAVYGIPRLTADVDATVALPPEKAEQLAAALRENGFVPRVSDVPGFVRDTRVLPMTHSASGMPLDLVRQTLAALDRALDRDDLASTFEEIACDL